MSQIATKIRLPRISFLQIGIILLTIITAGMHLYLGITMGSMTGGTPPSGGAPAGASSGGFSIMSLLPLPLPTLFILNFVGYVVLLGALYLPVLQRFQRLIRWLLIGYTAITILLWYLISGGHSDLMAYIDKFVEVVLIALLLIEGRWTRRRTA
jgi:hypothetical protein